MLQTSKIDKSSYHHFIDFFCMIFNLDNTVGADYTYSAGTLKFASSLEFYTFEIGQGGGGLRPKVCNLDAIALSKGADAINR